MQCVALLVVVTPVVLSFDVVAQRLVRHILAADGRERSGPKYAMLGPRKDIETLWQRPYSDQVKGIFFFAHGCNHQGTDLFSASDKDEDWHFDGCRQSLGKKCLALPEEMLLRAKMRKEGYLVAAVSGGSGVRSCWNSVVDAPRVKVALEHIRQEENLPNAPLILMGGSSGGHFMGQLLLEDLGHVKCAVPMISAIDIKVGFPKNVPILFLHMQRDKKTTNRVMANLEELKSMGVRSEAKEIAPERVTTDFLVHDGFGFSEHQAKEVVEALEKEGYLDSDGFLKEDPRRSNWRASVANLASDLGDGDAFEADSSKLSELLNIAYGQHECVGEVSKVLEFCNA